MTDPVTLDTPLICPMCGHHLTSTNISCPTCGEPIRPATMLDVTRDRSLSFLTGLISLLITAGCVARCIDLQFQLWQRGNHPIERHIASLNRDVMLLFTLFVSAWLWGPPLLRVAIHDPKSYGKEKVTSRWRVFWQTQIAMYALSVAFVLLCLVTCATR